MHHFHIYFSPQQEQQAVSLYHFLQEKNSWVKLGKFHPQPVGPHPVGSFAISVDNASYAAVYQLLWQMHGDLSVMIHPVTGDDIDDHLEDNIIWIGEEYAINRHFFA